jgi:hypothetical protein
MYFAYQFLADVYVENTLLSYLLSLHSSYRSLCQSKALLYLDASSFVCVLLFPVILGSCPERLDHSNVLNYFFFEYFHSFRFLHFIFSLFSVYLFIFCNWWDRDFLHLDIQFFPKLFSENTFLSPVCAASSCFTVSFL